MNFVFSRLIKLISDAAQSFSSSRRVPFIPQGEARECGVCCLAMIAQHHGYRGGIQNLRKLLSPNSSGTTLAGLIEGASALGLSARALRLDLNNLQHMVMPCIIHWGLDHFVVLENMNRRGGTIVDPAMGRSWISKNALSENFSGFALELTKGREIVGAESGDSSEFGIKFFVKGRSGIRRSLASLIMLSIALQLIALILPLYGQFVVDGLSASTKFTQPVNYVFLIFLIGVLCFFLTGLLRSAEVIRLSSYLGFRWSDEFMSHILRLPLSYFERRSSVDIFTRFRSLSDLKKTLTGTVVEALIDGLMAITTLAVMMAYSPLLAAISLIFVVFYAVVRAILTAKRKYFAHSHLVASSKENAHFQESIRAILPLKIYGRESTRGAAWRNLYADSVNAEVNHVLLSTTEELLKGAVLLVDGLVLFLLAGVYVVNEPFTVGMLVAFLTYKVLFSSRAMAFIDKIIEFGLMTVHLARLSDIAMEKPEFGVGLSPNAQGAQVGENRIFYVSQGGVDVCGLSFRYGIREQFLFQGVSFSVAPGECVAISGKSGSGKTTLLKLMLGLLEPVEGAVKIDGIPAYEFRGSRGTAGIAAVMQDDCLFAGTIAENVSFFSPEPDDARVEDALCTAAVLEDVTQMQMGVASFIGEQGSSLSGGQRQRLLLARALYSRPKLLFLDEATSQLDLATEARIHRALSNLSITRVIIAHRPETLEIADRIIDWDGVAARA